MVTPPIPTGSRRATGVSTPYRDTWKIMSLIVVMDCKLVNLCAWNVKNVKHRGESGSAVSTTTSVRARARNLPASLFFVNSYHRPFRTLVSVAHVLLSLEVIEFDDNPIHFHWKAASPFVDLMNEVKDLCQHGQIVRLSFHQIPAVWTCQY